MARIQRTSNSSRIVEGLFTTGVILLFSPHEFWDYLQYPYHTSKHKIIHLRMIPNEGAQLFGDPARSLTGVVPCKYYEQPISFSLWNLVHNMDLSKLRICVIAEMTMQASQVISSAAINNVPYCLNAAFLQGYSYTKSVYNGPIYLLSHFWLIHLKHPVGKRLIRKLILHD